MCNLKPPIKFIQADKTDALIKNIVASMRMRQVAPSLERKNLRKQVENAVMKQILTMMMSKKIRKEERQMRALLERIRRLSNTIQMSSPRAQNLGHLAGSTSP